MDNKMVLFDKDSYVLSEDGNSAYSTILHVPIGSIAILSLYNMTAGLDVKVDEFTGKKVITSDDCAVVHKLSIGRVGELDVELKCNETVNITDKLNELLRNRRLLHEPVTQCGGAWALNPCNNYAVIPVPGFYMLELFDVDQFDTAYIEYVIAPAECGSVIPDDFKLGSK